MRNLDPSRRRWVKVRIALLALLLMVGASAVLHRAYDLQISQGAELRREADEQQLRDVRLAPKRGTIYDRHGAELAVSVDVESVYANPRQMRRENVDVESAAIRLSAALGVDRERVLSRLSSDRYFAWIERQVTPQEAAAVRAMAIPGIELTRESRRFYPNHDLAAHLLGFANVDGVGIEGLELSMEERLHGSTESVPATVDRRGRVVFSETLLDDRAAQGDDLYLTIDKTVQHVAERELALAVRTFEAQSGSVVVMDPANGEILALANFPTFDPNDAGASPASHRRNRAITDRFEPGSTIKTFTVAAALAAGMVRPNQEFDCSGDERHRLVIDSEGNSIGDHGRDYGVLTPAEILAHSSNIGATLIGMSLGRSGLYRGLRRFGFGEPTGLPLPGETGGILRHHQRWYDMDLATISFGQGMSITTIQLATAMSAVANGGRLMEPTLIRRVVDARSEVVEEASPRVRRQVVPRATARLVSDMLTGVTGEEGTGLEAAIDGYLVAGKTGTAQKADYRRGGYEAGLYTASFVGFAPADAPRVVIAVVIDEPMIDHYGGVVAGPVFRRVGEATLRHLGVPASGGGEVLADIEREGRRRVREERQRAREERQRAREEREAGVETEIAAAPEVEVREPAEGEVLVPDLRGVGARRALVVLAEAGLEAQLEGTGVAVAQTPAAGGIVARGARVRVVLEAPVWHEPAMIEEATETAEAATDAAAATGAIVISAPARARARR
ncbi:penicillin-binding protein [Sandaracinus amylolyticus]|uniref:penicillin-binding protein n=1 Tax=Sandaracinus amylolyticus TaxID=927083 RepID=UPI001F39FE3F|nr:penicillin-binding protein [Sandaracinus amylolyticus]UJR80113.1 Peptidoglycan transglycosylase and transpeptidase FtsI [Sandaracinus amylolyticus]